MSIIIITIPLISAITIFFTSKIIGQEGGKIISIKSMIITVIISIIYLIENIKYKRTSLINIGEWLDTGIIKTKIEMILDKESIIMINLINLISLIVIIYSIFYMSTEIKRNKFLILLIIFSVSMSLLVLANNYLIMFIGWELVGIISFLLINFWNNSINNNKSAFKAFIFNKIGDIGYIIGIIISLNINNTLNINNIIYYNNEEKIINEIIIEIMMILLLIAAIAKSAQIILHCWLGDAMSGPTPVSALLHAATMVTAGIFLLIRINSLNVSSPLIEYGENNNIINKKIIIIIGLLTIIFTGLSAIYQKDIKKIIAYSTCSQIGYMFINNGLEYINKYASLFHLITHGFFKALLFLSSGIIIHKIFNEQDIRKYGSLLFKLPLTYMLFIIGTFTIIGFPFLSAYYSKENILLLSLYFKNNLFIISLLLLGAILTSYYSIILIIKTFIKYSNNNHSFIFKSGYPDEIYSLSLPIIIFYFIFSLLIIGSLSIGLISKDYFLFEDNTINTSSPGGRWSSELSHITGASHGLKKNIINNWIDFELLPTFIKILPIILLLIILLFFLINLILDFYYFNFFNSIFFNFFNSKWIDFINYFNRRSFFDSIYNYFFSLPLLIISYQYSFKYIDRGFLEYFGPVGFFRLFYFFPRIPPVERPTLYITSFQSLEGRENYYNYIFIYFFISFILFIIFFISL